MRVSPLSPKAVQVRDGKSNAGDAASWGTGVEVVVDRALAARVGDAANPNAPADVESVCAAVGSLPLLLP